MTRMLVERRARAGAELVPQVQRAHGRRRHSPGEAMAASRLKRRLNGQWNTMSRRDDVVTEEARQAPGGAQSPFQIAAMHQQPCSRAAEGR